MTWRELQTLTETLLIGDHTLVKDPLKRLALLDYAFHEVANKAMTMRLLTENVDEHIIRQAKAGFFIREAVLPENDDEILDIDKGLSFAVARFIASFVSKDPNNIAKHKQEAMNIIVGYNAKVVSFLETEIQNTGEAYDTNITRPSIDY